MVKPAARASQRRRPMRRRSPRGAMHFRPIACCRRSSTGHGSRSPSRWRSRLRMQCRRAVRRCPTGCSRCRSPSNVSARAGSTRRRRSRAAVALRTGVPLTQDLRRVRDSPPQAGLPLAARARNVRGAFEAVTRLDGLAVAIVDDVMTTGATLAAAAVAARAAGARRVEAGSWRAPCRRRSSATDAGLRRYPHVRRRPRPPGDSAEHRQRDPAHREYGDRAASRRAAGIPDGRPGAARAPVSIITSTRACAVHRDFAACRAALDRRRAAPLVRVHDAGERARHTTSRTRPATC